MKCVDRQWSAVGELLLLSHRQTFKDGAAAGFLAYSQEGEMGFLSVCSRALIFKWLDQCNDRFLKQLGLNHANCAVWVKPFFLHFSLATVRYTELHNMGWLWFSYGLSITSSQQGCHSLHFVSRFPDLMVSSRYKRTLLMRCGME